MRYLLLTLLAIAPAISHAQGELRILDAEVTLEVASNVEPYKSQTFGLSNIEVDGSYEDDYRLRSGIPQAPRVAEVRTWAIMQIGPFEGLHDGYGALEVSAAVFLLDFTFASGEQVLGTFGRASGWYDLQLTVPARVDILSLQSETELAEAFTISGQTPESYYPPFSNELLRRPIYLTAGTHRVQFDTGAAGLEGNRSALLIFNPVPEPSSVALILVGLGGLLCFRR